MKVSVLIPTYNRLTALVATLTALTAQDFKDFEVVVADQSDNFTGNDGVIQTLQRIFQLHQTPLRIVQNLPKKGIAHQRQFLLDQSTSKYSLYLDDDIILEPDVIDRMVKALEGENAGFVGMMPIGLSYSEDVRPHQHQIEFWEEPVQPETILPKTAEWQRHIVHNAANIMHVGQQLNINPENQQKYKIAWVGGCILYDTGKLRENGGFTFWEQLPEEHCGEEVYIQQKLMKKYGGFGLLPSGGYHLELPTTLVNREVNAPEFFRD
jgi:glycosyltransferase involved in cell wall biosynthesis